MFKACTAHSTDLRPEVAARTCVKQCQDQLTPGEPPPAAGLLFSSLLDADHEKVLRIILDAFPDIELIGCTTDGETSDYHGFIDESLALCLLCSDQVQFAAGLGRDISSDPAGALRSARDEALAKLQREPSLALVLPDGLTTIGLPLDMLLRDAFGQSFPVFGGTAGDLFRMQRTVQFAGGKAASDAVAVLLLAGDFHYGGAAASGWTPIGRRYSLNSVRNNRVMLIDDKPALQFYRSFLGNNMEEFRPFPLAVFEPGCENFYLRDPAFFNEDDQSIDFVGNFPQGAEVQLTEVGRSEILDAAHLASQQALAEYTGQQPELCLIFSCASRRQILGTKANEECSRLKELKPDDAPFAGFYTYGEIAPLKHGGPVHFHNDTYVVLALGSK